MSSACRKCGTLQARSPLWSSIMLSVLRTDQLCGFGPWKLLQKDQVRVDKLIFPRSQPTVQPSSSLCVGYVISRLQYVTAYHGTQCVPYHAFYMLKIPYLHLEKRQAYCSRYEIPLIAFLPNSPRSKVVPLLSNITLISAYLNFIFQILFNLN